MMLSLFYFVFWTIMAGANFVRPSALHRGYSIFWLFIIGWAVLVANTVFEDRFRIGAGYVFIFFQAAVFLASTIALCELVGLPTRKLFAERGQEDDDPRRRPASGADEQGSPGHSESGGGNGEEEESEPAAATETTPLVGSGSSRDGRRKTFSTIYRRSVAAITSNSSLPPEEEEQPYEYEQPWSAKLPSWVWIVQFLLLGPFFIILVAQTGLVLVSSVSQTGSDGSGLLVPYLLVAFFSILLLLPTTPFMHRITHHVPMFLLVVFIATLIYNLVAFPFSSESRYKIYFQQTVDLDTSASTVSYMGIEEYAKQIVAELPSATGKKVNCTASERRSGLTACSYDGSGILPNVVKSNLTGDSPHRRLTEWITYNITRAEDDSRATLDITAKETRSCAITFDRPISSFKIHGGSEPDERFGPMPKDGFKKLTLYRRDWDAPWKVDVGWKVGPGEDPGISGRVLCGWDDVNWPGAIPAFDEGIKFSPAWAALSKATAGLVEGSKGFEA